MPERLTFFNKDEITVGRFVRPGIENARGGAQLFERLGARWTGFDVNFEAFTLVGANVFVVKIVDELFLIDVTVHNAPCLR